MTCSWIILQTRSVTGGDFSCNYVALQVARKNCLVWHGLKAPVTREIFSRWHVWKVICYQRNPISCNCLTATLKWFLHWMSAIGPWLAFLLLLLPPQIYSTIELINLITISWKFLWGNKSVKPELTIDCLRN